MEKKTNEFIRNNINKLLLKCDNILLIKLNMFLFIDTISINSKLILLKNNNIINFRKIPTKSDKMISDVILKELLALLNKDNIINNIKFIGVCTGPGSYTSLRIGIASAIGLSFSSNKKLYGFSAIDLLLSYAKINYKLNSVCLLIQSQNDQNFLISINKEKIQS